MSWNPADPRQRYPGASPAAIPGNSTPAMGSPPQHAYYPPHAASPYTTMPSPFAGTPGGYAPIPGGSTPYGGQQQQHVYNPSASPYAQYPHQPQQPQYLQPQPLPQPQPQPLPTQEYIPEYTGPDPWAMYIELRRTGQLDPYWIAWAENQRAMGQYPPGGAGGGLGESTRYQPPPAIGRGPRGYNGVVAPVVKPPGMGVGMRPAAAGAGGGTGGGGGGSHRRTSHTATPATGTTTGQGGQGMFTKPDPPIPLAPAAAVTTPAATAAAAATATSSRPQPYVNPERAGLIPGAVPAGPTGSTSLPPKPPVTVTVSPSASAPPTPAAPSTSKSNSRPTEPSGPFPTSNSIISLSEMRQAKTQEYTRALLEKRPLNLKGIGLGQVGQGAAVDVGLGAGRAGDAPDVGLGDTAPAGGVTGAEGSTASKGLYLDDEDALIYRVGQRGISNEYLTSILPPQPELPADASPEATWDTPIGQVKKFFYAEMVFQLKESRDRDLLEKQKQEKEQAGLNGDGHADGVENGHGATNGHGHDWDMDVDDEKDRLGAWDDAELWPPEECEKDLSDLVV